MRVLDKNTFDRRSDILAGVKDVDEQVATGQADLEEGEHKHHHHTGPEEPVPGRRTADDHVVVFKGHGIVVHVLEFKVN